MARRVSIVDDHAKFRALARAMLERGGFEVVGEAVDGAETLTAVARTRPEVVLLDVQSQRHEFRSGSSGARPT